MACGWSMPSFRLTTNRCRRRMHCPRIVSDIHEVRTTTGMAAGHWSRSLARTILNSRQPIRRRKLVLEDGCWIIERDIPTPDEQARWQHKTTGRA